MTSLIENPFEKFVLRSVLKWSLINVFLFFMFFSFSNMVYADQVYICNCVLMIFAHNFCRSWSTCREQRLSALFEIHSLLSKHPARQNCFSSDLCIFCLLSSTKSVQVYLVTRWKDRVIFSSHQVEMTHVNSKTCRTKRLFTVLRTLHVTWRQRKEILCPTLPKTIVWNISIVI